MQPDQPVPHSAPHSAPDFAPGRWPEGGGEMATRIRSLDWSRTPLGPLPAWPVPLKTMVEHMLASPLVSSMVCGRTELVLLYNDAAARLYGGRHPAALGRPLPETFPEGWAAVAPLYRRVFAGESVRVEGMHLDTRGDGDAATDVFDAVLLPVRHEDGFVAWAHMSGMLVGDRVRAEAALRDSEARFRQFADASSDALWIRAADTLAMEYASPAFEAVYGVARAAMMGEGDPERWAALIVPEDRQAAMTHLERARAGQHVAAEFRIRRPADDALRWIRDLGFPLRDEAGQVRRIGGIATDVTEFRQSAEHQTALVGELQHRVRNTLAVIRAMAARTARTATSVEDYAATLDGRLATLGRVQAQLTRAANAGAVVGGIVRAEFETPPLRDVVHELVGPEIVLAPKAAEVFALAVHELASNARKHGCLADPQARIHVSWRTERRGDGAWLLFDWHEACQPGHEPQPAPGPPQRGFGLELIETRIAYELEGHGELVIEPHGARCHLEFPLRQGASVLETGVPHAKAHFDPA